MSLTVSIVIKTALIDDDEAKAVGLVDKNTVEHYEAKAVGLVDKNTVEHYEALLVLS